MKQLGALLVAVVLVTVGCGSQRFSVGPIDQLRSAAKRASSAEAAALRGSMASNGTRFVTLTGVIEPHDRDASVVTADAHDPAGFPPFEARFVGGSTYVAIDSAVERPPGLSPSANWVTYAGARTTREIPIPSVSMPPGFVFTVFDQLLTHPIADVNVVDKQANGSTKIQFQLPDLASKSTLILTVSIDSGGQIGEVVVASHIVEAKASYEQDTDLTFVWGGETAAIVPPPNDEVQPLGDLYPSTTSTTTTTTTPALGRVDESDAVAGNKAVFDGDRTQLAAQLGAQADPKLTAFTYNTAENTIDAAFSYAPATPPSKGARDLFAWHVGKTLSDTFWSPGLVQAVHGLNGPDSWLPELRIRLGPSTYLCLASVEIAVDAQQISEAGWLRQCAT